MKLNDTFDLGKPPFQGDRTLEWRRIPLGAQIQRATAIVTPIDATAGLNPFAEIIRFTGATGDWGATKTQVPSQWVEVDFHGRRTLASVLGGDLTSCTLQVDLGGAYVEINTNGGLKAPGDTLFTLPGNTASLPGLAVTKFKLTRATGAGSPNITNVTIRSVPTNVSLRFGQQPVFWTRVGEQAQAETTPDFAASLEAFLADAEVENGFYVVPLVVHSDAIARLRIEFEIEFVVQQGALPKGLSEITLPYELDGLPKSSSELITITAPAGARIVPQSSRARITGAFADTRIVHDPTETVSSEGFVKTIAPAGKVVISGQDSFAQPISLARDTAATAIDLRLEIKEAVKLRLDIREDLDGKPGEVSLLPQPVDVELPGPVGLEQSREASDRERWISIPLSAEFQFKEAGRQKRYWLALQSIEGEAAWSVAAATAAPQPAETVGLQRLSHRPSDAGLAWREAATTGAGGPLFAFFRLRHLPKRFTMPVAMQVGAGAGAVRVDLGRFQDQGRVDFALDFEELEQARQKHLSKAAPKVCPDAEHLANGEFTTWMVADEQGNGSSLVDLDFACATPALSKGVGLRESRPTEWNLTSGRIVPRCLGAPFNAAALIVGRSSRDETEMPASLSQVTPVAGGCAYEFSFWALASEEGAVAEIFWLGKPCGFLSAADPIAIEAASDPHHDPGAVTFTQPTLRLHRVRVTAPAQAEQAEVRFSLPAGAAIILDRASLMGTSDAVTNGEFQLRPDGQVEGWTTTPGLSVDTSMDGLQLRNDSASVIEMAQTASAKSDQPFKLELRDLKLSSSTSQPPRLEAHWFKADGAVAGSPVVIELRADTTNSAIAQGQSPPGAEKVEVRLTLPPGAALSVRQISLRFQQMISVPVTFVAQAPGELAITGLQIAFEDGRPAPPPIPDRGLCPPTPPGGQPGTGKSDCSFCPGCESEKSMTEVRAMVTDAGRPVLAGACPDCGADLLRFGGALDAGAPRLSFARSIRQPLVVRARPERDAGLATTISTAPVTESPAPAETDLIEVSGIGAARADALKKIGVKTAEALATASPEKVAKAKGFTPAIAQKAISAAERLIAANLL